MRKRFPLLSHGLESSLGFVALSDQICEQGVRRVGSGGVHLLRPHARRSGRRIGCEVGVLGNIRGIDCIRHFIGYARLLADQIERRVLKGEVIGQEEKVFSVFEPHTRWNNKGKAGGLVEIGVPVCVLEDQHQFILDHRITWEEEDMDVAVPVVKGCKETYPNLKGYSFDRDFYSPVNREALDGLLDINALPKKGKLNGAERMRESEEEFVSARRRHPAVESANNNLEYKGLGRVCLHGEEGFERAVAIAVAAYTTCTESERCYNGGSERSFGDEDGLNEPRNLRTPYPAIRQL